MKVRRLQRKNEQNQWYDDSYAFEDSNGQVVFRYNLTWESVGSRCNGKLRETGVSLEEIEAVIPTGDRIRWLPIEVIEDEQAEAYLEVLNEKCGIPKPRSIAHKLDSLLAA